MRVIKKLDYTRCPWCGTPYDAVPEHPHDFVKGNGVGVYGHFCTSCGKWGRYYFCSMGIIMFFAFEMILLSLPIPRIISLFISFMIGLIFIGKTPYYRHPDYGKYLTPEEPKLCTITIHWYSLRDGGIGFPRFRIYNHMIFPICFVDQNDQPVTQTGCVRLCKKWFILFKGARLRLITDVIDAHKIQEGMKFYIFNQGARMGEGVVKTYLYRNPDGK